MRGDGAAAVRDVRDLTEETEMTTRSPFALAILLAALGGCAAAPASLSLEPVALAVDEPPMPPPPPSPPPPPTFHAVVMWLPNRVIDLFDVARAGVDLGPGIGLDFAATHYARIAAMTRTSGGLGFQTFRHPPVKFGHEDYMIAGHHSAEAGIGNGWYQHVYDFRIELHVLIVGAHAAVNVGEIFDFFAGFFFFDPMNDDY
jgi:hypothetical protein